MFTSPSVFTFDHWLPFNWYKSLVASKSPSFSTNPPNTKNYQHSATASITHLQTYSIIKHNRATSISSRWYIALALQFRNSQHRCLFFASLMQRDVKLSAVLLDQVKTIKRMLHRIASLPVRIGRSSSSIPLSFSVCSASETENRHALYRGSTEKNRSMECCAECFQQRRGELWHFEWIFFSTLTCSIRHFSLFTYHYSIEISLLKMHWELICDCAIPSLTNGLTSLFRLMQHAWPTIHCGQLPKTLFFRSLLACWMRSWATLRLVSCDCSI